MADERLLQKEMSQRATKIIGYFAQDTIDKIFEHIERLDIRDTGALRNSIRAVVHQNAGGKDALVQIFHEYYGDMVEQAVGKYYGVDSDLGKGVGVKSQNIAAPQIDSVGYGPMTGSFSGLPGGKHGQLRRATHKPRPFLRSEINRQVERISYRLMRDLGDLIQIHMLDLTAECLGSEIYNAVLAPFQSNNPNAPRCKLHFPDGQTQEIGGGQFYNHWISFNQRKL